jgi:putative N-acetylmannosamine-6-phosphate epimerase
MLGATLYVEDLEDIDPQTARSCIWILKNYIGDDLEVNFTYEEDVLGAKKVVELVPGGAEVFVIESNKKEYVKKLAYTKMTENIREQSMAFMAGVEKVLSVNYLKLLNYKEIGKFLSGCAVISVP